MCKALQHRGILTAIPLEEHLIRAENARHTIDRHMTVFQNMQVVIPELVLDEEGHHRTNGPEEAAGVGNRVEWQIGDDVSPLVVFPHLITRRREERQQDLVFRMFPPQLLHQRASLLKLAQRGSMEPHILGIRINFLAQDLESLTLSPPHLAHLLVEATVDRYT